jgi:hypothetical protein
MFFGLFSGTSAWVIPIEGWIYSDEDEGMPIGINLNFDKAIISDNWLIRDGNCFLADMDGFENCAIAIPPERLMWKTAPVYASMKGL